MDYAEAEAFLSGGRNKSSRPIADLGVANAINHTRVERLDADTIGIRFHDTHIVKLRRDGTFELNTGGWYSMSTKERMSAYSPVTVFASRTGWRVSTRKIYIWDDKDAPLYFDGIVIGPNGTVMNPRPREDEEQVKRENDALWKRIVKYTTKYIEAAQQQIYVDALYQEPEGAISCWDCSHMAMAGRTSGDGSPKAHLLRHLDGPEFPPDLFYNALRAKGAGPYYFQMVGLGTDYIVDLSRETSRSMLNQYRRWIRDLLKGQLMTGMTGYKPFHDYSSERRDSR